MDFNTENIIAIDEKKASLLQQLQEQDWEEFRERKRDFILNWFGQEFLDKVEAAFPDVRLFLEGEPVHPLEIEARRIYDGKNPAQEQDNFDAVKYNRDREEHCRAFFSRELGITLQPVREETEEEQRAQSKLIQETLLRMIEEAKQREAANPIRKVFTFPAPDTPSSVEADPSLV